MSNSRILGFVEEVASQPGNDSPLAPWPTVLACAFAAANAPAAVPVVYLRAIKPHGDNAEARRLILRRVKEAFIKGTWLFGVPRALNAFYPLAAAIPDEDSIDPLAVRGSMTNPLDPDLTERGLDFLENIRREEFVGALGPMDRMFPDLRTLTVNLLYGPYMSETSVLGAADTSMAVIASLVPIDVPVQVGWHMKGLIRNGGTEAQLREAMNLSVGATDAVGLKLKGKLPDIDEILEILKQDEKPPRNS